MTALPKRQDLAWLQPRVQTPWYDHTLRRPRGGDRTCAHRPLQSSETPRVLGLYEPAGCSLSGTRVACDTRQSQYPQAKARQVAGSSPQRSFPLHPYSRFLAQSGRAMVQHPDSTSAQGAERNFRQGRMQSDRRLHSPSECQSHPVRMDQDCRPLNHSQCYV